MHGRHVPSARHGARLLALTALLLAVAAVPAAASPPAAPVITSVTPTVGGVEIVVAAPVVPIEEYRLDCAQGDFGRTSYIAAPVTLLAMTGLQPYEPVVCTVEAVIDSGRELSVAVPTDAFLPLPPRPAAMELWPACTTAVEWYCVESATLDGTDILDGPGATYEGQPLYVAAWLLDESSVNWSVQLGNPWNGPLPDALAGARLAIALRTGSLRPAFTAAIAHGFWQGRDGDAATGYHVAVEGSPSYLNWRFADAFACLPSSCGDATTASTLRLLAFSGNTQSMATWDESSRAVFDGAYVATNAQYHSTLPLYAALDGSWYVDLANPHLTLDGDPATGAFEAWIPPAYFTAAGTTAAEAVAEGFHVTRRDGEVETTVAGAASLVDGGAYLRVDELGYSAPQLRVAPQVPGGTRALAAPDAPRVGTATPVRGGIALAFLPPRIDGGSPITRYFATCAQGGTTAVAAVGADARSATVRGLAAAPARCSVVAESAAGTSAPASARTATPLAAVAPDAPAITGIAPGRRSLAVSFAPPAEDGGSPLTGFVVTCTALAPPDAAPEVVELGPAARSATLVDLERTGAHRCTVVAESAAGASPASDPVTATPLAPGAPGAPGLARGALAETSVVLVLAAPASDGGSPVTGYEVRCATAGLQPLVVAAAAAGPVTVRGLFAARTYACRASARNAAGASAPSAPLAVATPGAAAPSAPRALHGTAAARRIVLGWSAPARVGWGPVTTYTALLCPRGRVSCSVRDALARRTLPGLATTLTVPRRLAAGRYAVLVSAANGRASGPAARVVLVRR